MKDENQFDKAGLRKSNRQRVPNSFYTEGINELKKQPRNGREPFKPARKRSKVYQDSEEASYLNQCFEDGRSENRDSGTWYPCKLPSNGQTVKVQFVLNAPNSDSAPTKRSEPAPKPSKKAEKKEAPTDLLSLFQIAIKDVNENEPVEKSEPEYVHQKRQPITRQRAEDPEGKILNVERTGDRLLLKHSKLGEVEMEMEGSEESSEEQLDLDLIEEYKVKFLNSQHLSQCSLFN